MLSQMDKTSEVGDHRWKVLLHCSEKLGGEARDLLHRCYVNGQRVNEIATQLGRTLAGTYAALSRIRRRLADCVQEQLRKEAE
jgi:DNA-directed RNA polymerase specialized sigma24 family protein